MVTSAPSTPRTIDFWFDYSCPYAYLASTRVEAMSARLGAHLTWKPMLLGGVFQAAGTPQNLMNQLSEQKARHNALDMKRWADIFGVELRIPEGHPLRTVEALRATLAVGVDPKVVHGFFHAYWVEGKLPSDRSTIEQVLSAAGHSPERILQQIQETAIKDELRARTDEAISLGIFGAPTFIVDGKELFWGQDRMCLVEGRDAWDELEPETPVDEGDRPTLVTPQKRDDGAAQHELEVYFDFSSPFAYLGTTQATTLAHRTGAKLIWRPMLLGGLFKGIGQVDVPMNSWSPAKRRHTMDDMYRWARHWGIQFNWPSRFPMNTVKALRAWLALPEAKRDEFRERAFRAYWVEDRDISSDDVLRELLEENADEVFAKMGTQEIKDALFAATKRAVDAGVFGAPTWVIDGKALYWGQDRIPLVERALKCDDLALLRCWRWGRLGQSCPQKLSQPPTQAPELQHRLHFLSRWPRRGPQRHRG